MIEIIEKEPYKSYDSWNERECLMYPNVMIKDGKEYFILNRREPDSEYQESENKKRLEKLIQTNGKYTIFYGKFENPFEMLREIISKKDLIITNSKDIFDRRMTNEESVDFHGNRENYSSAFMYRIYDKKLENDLREIVEYINKKEWDIAEGVLVEKEKQYKDFKIKKDITQGLDYNEFMKLINSKVESVKDCLNYETFKADIEVLKNANTGCGLSSITSNNWLKEICNLSETELRTYVDNYKPGLLNPYLNEYKNQEEEELET